jgi:hypothetical protein
VNAVLSVVVDERFPVLPKSKLARYLCPVLGKLVNYNHGHDNQIWLVFFNINLIILKTMFLVKSL